MRNSAGIVSTGGDSTKGGRQIGAALLLAGDTGYRLEISLVLRKKVPVESMSMVQECNDKFYNHKM